jgi:hypothetical protein
MPWQVAEQLEYIRGATGNRLRFAVGVVGVGNRNTGGLRGAIPCSVSAKDYVFRHTGLRIA